MASADDDDWGEDEEEVKTEAVKLDVEVLPDEDVDGDTLVSNVMVRIKVPESVSAGSDLTRTTSGVMKHDGLTYLDVVKHSIKAVINMLKAHDRLALVVFDDRADLIFELSEMTPEGKAEAMAALQRQRPRDDTDIWTGLYTGMEALRKPHADKGWRQKTVLLLTDGVPNISPPKGHIPELKAYKESHPDFSFQVNTFGFGYKLDSQLLLDLAVEGNGTFAFIPDALIVGTSFVNSLCNSLSTQTQSATLHLMPKGGGQILGPVIGIAEDMVADTSWGRVVSLGPLQFGQSREIVLPMKVSTGDEPYLQAMVVFPGADGRESRSEGLGTSRCGSAEAKIALCRCMAVDFGYDAARTFATANERLANLKAEMNTAFPNAEDAPETFKAVHTDVNGRMTKALDGEDRFKRWGKHYILSLTRAHQLQLCTNFIDPGLQVYGGTLFKCLRDEGDAIFLGMPPPEPMEPHVSVSAPAPAAAYRAPVAPSAPDPAANVYYGGGGGG